MSKIKNKKVIIIPAVIVLCIVAIVVYQQFFAGSTIADHSEKYKGANLEASDADGIGRSDTYTKYVSKDEYKNAASPSKEVVVDLFKYNEAKGASKISAGGETDVLQMAEDGYTQWKVNIPEAGFYNIYTEYYPIKGRGISIERELTINGTVPFSGADAIDFKRVYSDATEIKKDNQGNEIRPTQAENPSWQNVYFSDSTGYEKEPYKFYFNKGKNTIRLTGVNEPFAIRKLVIKNKGDNASYEEYSKKNSTALAVAAPSGYSQKIQGESAVRRSSPSLYASYDRSSGETEPKSIGKTKLNMTGGTQWRVAGDWIEFDTEVPEDGSYVIGIKGRQGYNRGFVATRNLSIDGVTPFEEVSEIQFTYSNTWSMTVLQDEKGNAYKFPLTKGKHTIRLSVTLGDFGELLSDLSDSVGRMNDMYRKILVLTGSDPDDFRDYQIEKVFPDVIKAMELESKRLYKLVDQVIAYTGESSQQVSIAQTLANQMELFVDRPDKIPTTLSNFKENISALGTAINTLAETSLDIDYIALADSKENLPEVTENGFDKAVHECQMFFNSFFSNSSSLGSVYEAGENTMDVWIVAGRDQSTILKTMVDDTFTPASGINVNVKLIDVATLLPAVVAGTGPDVALTVAQSEPVNYALRKAALDLNQFDDIDEVLSEYYPSSYEAYKFNGGIYALPETQNYNVLFYRTDICEELGIEIPDTWDDVLKILPVLQKSNMQIAVPSVERKIGNTTNPDLANYYAQLYQRDGRLYDEEGKSVTIATEAGIKAFEFYTKLFTNYKLEKQYDFVNRFRSGEMPIGIADYSNFNTLSVFAPEIKGLWKFDLIPGVARDDGTINRAVQSWGTCSMMLRSTKDPKKAWEFMKWWASSDTQTRFGRELESVMGASARYATANIKTFDELSWGSAEAAILKEQWKEAFGLPEVAGGYYTPRHITNAVRKVINDNEDPRETLKDYAKTIQEEIDKKRSEFGLEVAE